MPTPMPPSSTLPALAQSQAAIDAFIDALFLEDDWLITDQFTLTGGARMDHDERYGNHWSPRLYGVYHASEALTLRGGVTTGFKAPALRQSTAGYCMTTGGNSGFGPKCQRSAARSSNDARMARCD